MTTAPIRTPLTHNTWAVNGIKLHVVTAGDPGGPPLLMLHGFPEFWYSWRHQVDALVTAGFYLVMPDQRGYNRSDKPKDVKAYSLDLLADDILGLMDHIGVLRGNIVAHDWGGGAAWWAMNRNPERFERALLLNIPHHSVFSRTLKTSQSQRRKSRYMAFFQLKPIADWAVSAFNFRLLSGWAFAHSPAFDREDLRHYHRAWSQPGAIPAMLNWYRAVRSARPQRLESSQIHVKTRLMWGTADRALGVEMAQPSIELCDDGELILVEGASHWVQHEAPDVVNRAIIDFFLPRSADAD